MTNATFINWTDEAFVGHWNGKGKTFEPGYRAVMPEYLAEHFAKHLTNRELIKIGKETATSPKFPADQPAFMELFNKAFIGQTVEKEEDDIDGLISTAANEPSMDVKTEAPAPLTQGSPAAAQAAANAAPVAEEGATVITGPDDGEEEESGFALGQ